MTNEERITRIDRIMQNPTASFWLKGAIAKLETRDVLDAANDVAVLQELFNFHTGR